MESLQLLVLGAELGSQHLHQQVHLRQLLLHHIARQPRPSLAGGGYHLLPLPLRLRLRPRRSRWFRARLRFLNLCSRIDQRLPGLPARPFPSRFPLEEQHQRVSQREQGSEPLLLGPRSHLKPSRRLTDAHPLESIYQLPARLPVDESFSEDAVHLLQEPKHRVGRSDLCRARALVSSKSLGAELEEEASLLVASRVLFPPRRSLPLRHLHHHPRDVT
mmetsp:Transcript_23208/g.75494  ORF Transcript_23208/g.75494 Transcript_23208/m.75494 type:complete len:218 (-) Transcript_23208:1527-2180(-)